MIVIVDTNVVIAATSDNEVHKDWAIEQILDYKSKGSIAITEVIYSELSIAFESKDHVDDLVRSLGVDIVYSTLDSLFSAGKAFKEYRRRGGSKEQRSSGFFYRYVSRRKGCGPRYI